MKFVRYVITNKQSLLCTLKYIQGGYSITVCVIQLSHLDQRSCGVKILCSTGVGYLNAFLTYVTVHKL